MSGQPTAVAAHMLVPAARTDVAHIGDGNRSCRLVAAASRLMAGVCCIVFLWSIATAFEWQPGHLAVGAGVLLAQMAPRTAHSGGNARGCTG